MSNDELDGRDLFSTRGYGAGKRRLAEMRQGKAYPSAVIKSEDWVTASFFPATFGASKARMGLKNALAEAMNHTNPRADGGHDLCVDGVALVARSHGRTTLIHVTSIPAYAMLGKRYDSEHQEAVGKAGSQINPHKWDRFMAGAQTPSNGRY